MNEDFIQSNPSIMMGKPFITGTRITVELILQKLAAGETIEQLLEAHPRLTRISEKGNYRQIVDSLKIINQFKLKA